MLTTADDTCLLTNAVSPYLVTHVRHYSFKTFYCKTARYTYTILRAFKVNEREQQHYVSEQAGTSDT